MNILTQENPAKKFRTQEDFSQPDTASIESPPSHGSAPQIRNVLTVFNSSESSRVVLEYSRLFAEQFGATITIIYAVVAGDSVVSAEQLREELTRVAGIKRAAIRAVVVRPGAMSFLQITDAAHSEMADLIVLSGRVELGLSHFFQNNPIEKMISHAPCPVLVVCNNEAQPTSGQDVRIERPNT